MLNRLYVKNYAIIDETEVYFNDGLNILTGETGAGKSILIGSVNAALGAKTSRDVIRYGADYALIELGFNGLSDTLVKKLSDRDIFPDDGEIVISRKLTAAGKSICKINGETVTLENMREISGMLLDIHGQNEHQSLYRTASHIGFLDRYAGAEVQKKTEALSVQYKKWNEIKKELDAALDEASSKDRDLGYLEYASDEIEKAELVIGEDAKLEEEYRLLSNSKQIMEALSGAMHLVNDGDDNASEKLDEAIRLLSKVSDYDARLMELQKLLEDASSMMSDFEHDACSYIDKTENMAERFSEVSERLDLINGLKKKYISVNGSIEELLDYAASAREKIEKYNNFDEYTEKLKKAEKTEKDKCLKICDELSTLREKAAKKLSEGISEALLDLNFASATFVCKLEKNEKFTANGQDACEFMISLNPGEPLKALAKIASGGELSRVMLAIKSVIADKDEIPSMIFDEIDTGISGRTAQKVSEKLALIAHTHQIICITHLAQIAAMADRHYLIEKTNFTDSVKTEIIELSDDERIEEIARILGGAEITETVTDNASEMIELAKKYKAKQRL